MGLSGLSPGTGGATSNRNNTPTPTTPNYNPCADHQHPGHAGPAVPGALRGRLHRVGPDGDGLAPHHLLAVRIYIYIFCRGSYQYVYTVYTYFVGLGWLGWMGCASDEPNRCLCRSIYNFTWLDCVGPLSTQYLHTFHDPAYLRHYGRQPLSIDHVQYFVYQVNRVNRGPTQGQTTNRYRDGRKGMRLQIICFACAYTSVHPPTHISHHQSLLNTTGAARPEVHALGQRAAPGPQTVQPPPELQLRPQGTFYIHSLAPLWFDRLYGGPDRACMHI